MAFPEEPFDLQRIRDKFNITQRWIEGCGLSEDKLKKIYDNYKLSIPVYLEKIKTGILTELNEELAGIAHSVRGRIKEPDHLIEKIIRNKSEKPAKYAALDEENYNKIITDLIGFRIIILDKRDWRGVHDILMKMFRNLPDRYVTCNSDIVKNYDKYAYEWEGTKRSQLKGYHAEKPVVYLTDVDNKELYKDDFLTINSSKTHYRSIHYIIRYQNVYFEIQVRTLFEEGWLEFDHRVKYPYDQNNKKKQEFLAILNSLATAADRLIAFYDEEAFQSAQDNLPEEQDNLAADSVVDMDYDKQGCLNDRLPLYFNGR